MYVFTSSMLDNGADFEIGYATMAGFVGFTVTLFAVAPKADAASVFVTVVNDTGCVFDIPILPPIYDNSNRYTAILLQQWRSFWDSTTA